MKVKRIVHSILCLVLCCCILLHSLPVKAEASAAGAAALITGAAGVSVAAPLAIGASLIALGIMASNTNPLVFENTVNDAVASLSAAGTWVKDGAVELLQTIDETGQKAYYVAGDMLEDLRSYVFDNSIVLTSAPVSREFLSAGSVYDGKPIDKPSVVLKWCSWVENSSVNVGFASHYIIFCLEPGYQYVAGASGNSFVSVGGNRYWYKSFSAFSGYVLIESLEDKIAEQKALGFPYVAGNPSIQDVFLGYGLSEYSTSLDLTLGSIPSFSLDGTVSDNAFKDFLSKQQRFSFNNNSGGDGDGTDDYKWSVPIVLGVAGTVYAMTQFEQWTGSTPADFEDYTVKTEYDVSSGGLVSGYPGYILTPSKGGTGSDTEDDVIPVVPPAIGGGSTVITPAEGLQGTLTETKAQTFLDSIGAFFAGWLDAILQWLQALWELIKAGVITIAEAIAALPAAIGEVFTNVLTWAFVPAASFVDAEVTALCADFPLANTFKGLVTNFRSVFSGFNGEPPVIYIHLEDAEGSYNYGGAVPILDMRWYARYKPIGDTLLSALMWAFFLWRLLVHAPNIIGGLAGDIEAFNSGPSGGIYSSDNPYRSGAFSKPSRGKYESRRKQK